jgi:hypothetical protein
MNRFVKLSAMTILVVILIVALCGCTNGGYTPPINRKKQVEQKLEPTEAEKALMWEEAKEQLLVEYHIVPLTSQEKAPYMGSKSTADVWVDIANSGNIYFSIRGHKVYTLSPLLDGDGRPIKYSGDFFEIEAVREYLEEKFNEKLKAYGK